MNNMKRFDPVNHPLVLEDVVCKTLIKQRGCLSGRWNQGVRQPPYVVKNIAESGVNSYSLMNAQRVFSNSIIIKLLFLKFYGSSLPMKCAAETFPVAAINHFVT